MDRFDDYLSVRKTDGNVTFMIKLDQNGSNELCENDKEKKCGWKINDYHDHIDYYL